MLVISGVPSPYKQHGDNDDDSWAWTPPLPIPALLDPARRHSSSPFSNQLPPSGSSSLPHSITSPPPYCVFPRWNYFPSFIVEVVELFPLDGFPPLANSTAITTMIRGGWILHCRSRLCLTQPEGTATPHIANQGVASHPSSSSPEISSV